MSDIIKIDGELSQKQYKAIELYLEGGDIDVICKTVDIQPSTFRKWMNENKEFRSIIKQSFNSYLTVNNTFLTAAHEKSIKKLVDMLDDNELSTKNSLSVIKMIQGFVKDAVQLQKDTDDEMEIEMTQTITKDENNKVLSITEQKNILQRLRGVNNGPQEILDKKINGDENVGATTERVLPTINADLGGNTQNN